MSQGQNHLEPSLVPPLLLTSEAGEEAPDMLQEWEDVSGMQNFSSKLWFICIKIFTKPFLGSRHIKL